MANRLVVQADIDNPIYSNWLIDEDLPVMVLDDILLDTLTSASAGQLYYELPVAFGAARATPTIWVDVVGIAASGTLKSISLWGGGSSEWDRSVTLRPLRGRVDILQNNAGVTKPISITNVRNVIIDGETNSYPGLRNGQQDVFLTGQFGFRIHGTDEPTKNFLGVEINNIFSTDSNFIIRGVEASDGFAGFRINEGGGGIFPVVNSVLIERNYRHDSDSGEGIYMGWTGLESSGYSSFDQVIIRHNSLIRCATEAIQVQHITNETKRSSIYNNISIGASNWIAPFGGGQDNNTQFLTADGNVRIYNNIFDQAGFSFFILQASADAVTLPQTDTFKIKNNLCVNGKGAGMYLHNFAIQGVVWEIIENYFIKFNTWYSDVLGEAPITNVAAEGTLNTDQIDFVGNIKDTTRATFFGADFSTNLIDNGANDDTLQQPNYIQAGLDYAKFKGIWSATKANDGVTFITWNLDDFISIFTNLIGVRFYKCILTHTSTASSDPVIDVSEWVQMTWDESGVRVDEVGHISGDIQSNMPPDNFTITADELWNQKDMGHSFTDAPSNFSKFKWYYADDAIGTNLIQLAYEKEGIFDINAIGHEWIARKTGKYIIGSITPVDSNGLIGTETFATGIII